VSTIFLNYFASKIVGETLADIARRTKRRTKLTLRERGLLQALVLKTLNLVAGGRPPYFFDILAREYVARGAPKELVPLVKEKTMNFITTKEFDLAREFGREFNRLLDKHGLLAHDRQACHLFANRIFKILRKTPKCDRWKAYLMEFAYYATHYRLDEDVLAEIARLVEKYYDMIMK